MEIVTMTMRSPWWGVNGRREEARNYNNKRELLVRGVWKYLTVTRRQWAPCSVPCIAWIYTETGEYAHMQSRVGYTRCRVGSWKVVCR